MFSWNIWNEIKELRKVWKYKKLSSLLKPIKSFDAHILEKHSFWSDIIEWSKFIEWADIKKLVKEWYNKKNKRIKETISKDDITWEEIPSIAIKVDMWRKIWTNLKYNWEYNKLTIIVDYSWNVISAYPMYNFRIK